MAIKLVFTGKSRKLLKDLKRELKRLWNKKVVLVPIIIGALETVSKKFNLYLKKAGLDGSILLLQKACLLGTARIIRESQWSGGFYGYRLTFSLFYGYRLIFLGYG